MSKGPAIHFCLLESALHGKWQKTRAVPWSSFLKLQTYCKPQLRWPRVTHRCTSRPPVILSSPWGNAVLPWTVTHQPHCDWGALEVHWPTEFLKPDVGQVCKLLFSNSLYKAWLPQSLWCGLMPISRSPSFSTPTTVYSEVLKKAESVGGLKSAALDLGEIIYKKHLRNTSWP